MRPNKTDVVGLWALLQAIADGWLTSFDENTPGRDDFGALLPVGPFRRGRGARRRNRGPVELVSREGRGRPGGGWTLPRRDRPIPGRRQEPRPRAPRDRGDGRQGAGPKAARHLWRIQ